MISLSARKTELKLTLLTLLTVRMVEVEAQIGSIWISLSLLITDFFSSGGKDQTYDGLP